MILAILGMLCPGTVPATAGEPYLFEIYSQGHKYPSLKDYRIANLKGKTITIGPDGTLKEEKAGPDGLPIPANPIEQPEKVQIDRGPQERIAGVGPSFEDLAQGLYGQDVTLKQVSSSDDMFMDLRERLLGSNAPVLIISDHRKTRVLRLEEGGGELTDDTQPALGASKAIISP